VFVTWVQEVGDKDWSWSYRYTPTKTFKENLRIKRYVDLLFLDVKNRFRIQI